MQNPTMKTSVARCIHLGRYAARMMSKFPQNTALVGYAAQMTDITTPLEKSSLAYEASKLVIVEARVDVRFADFTSDAEVKQLLRRAELADGKSGGPIVKALAPDGQTPLVKPFGQKQVDVLVDLEGTLSALASTWPAASQEKVTVEGLRSVYEKALQTRDDAWQNARNLRKARDLAKQAFVTAYVQLSFSVKALFPDDRKMQDLFFDDVENDVEKDVGGETETPAPTPTPAPGGATG